MNRIISFHFDINRGNVNWINTSWNYIYCFRAIQKPYHSSDRYSPASHLGCPYSIPGQIMSDFWWTKWHWGRCSPNISLPIVILPTAAHSFIIRGWYKRSTSGWRTKWTHSTHELIKQICSDFVLGGNSSVLWKSRQILPLHAEYNLC
jgi:hypothetical protein